MTILVLDTPRLVLRGHVLSDFDASAAMWSDAGVTRYIGGRASTEEESWSRFLRYAGHWAVMGFGYWAVIDKASGALIGEVGFADFKREIDPPLAGAHELGWVLGTAAHGRGLATEAVRAALDWKAKHFRSARTVAIIAPENLASIRVAEKCGFVEQCRTTYKSDPTILYELRDHA